MSGSGQLAGTDEIRVEAADRVLDNTVGSRPRAEFRTAGVYLPADPSDLEVLEGGSQDERNELITRAPLGVEVRRDRILSTDRVGELGSASIAPRDIDHLNVLSGRR